MGENNVWNQQPNFSRKTDRKKKWLLNKSDCRRHYLVSERLAKWRERSILGERDSYVPNYSKISNKKAGRKKMDKKKQKKKSQPKFLWREVIVVMLRMKKMVDENWRRLSHRRKQCHLFVTIQWNKRRCDRQCLLAMERAAARSERTKGALKQTMISIRGEKTTKEMLAIYNTCWWLPTSEKEGVCKSYVLD